MKIHSQQFRDASPDHDWESIVGFVGVSCDERGDRAIAMVRERTRQVHMLTYDPDKLLLSLDDESVEIDELPARLRILGDAFVFEATTLGTTELVLASRGAKSNGTSRATYLYVEPQGYRRPRVERVIHARDFDLTREYSGFQAVPGLAFMLEHGARQTVVFFLGFEGERLDQAFEQLPIDPACASAVFGVPAFRPGWEVNAFANNARLLRERGIGSSIYYCGANDPATTFRLLDKIYSEKNSGQRLFVAPIGTKPQAIGLAIFLAAHNDVGLLYDHPIRGVGRSEGCGVWHIFDVELQ
jgi:hypothetical protein